MRWRAIQPAVFGLAALSFILPFANVSCATDPDIAQTGSPVLGTGDDEPPAEFKGYELVVGRAPVDGMTEEFSVDNEDVRFGGEPFAALAFLAALAGVCVVFLSRPRVRAGAGVACGGAGLVSLIVLGLAPVLRTYGVLSVSWGVGYWVCLVLFAAATAVSYLEQREARPPPYLRE